MKLSILAVATAPFALLATQATAAPVVTAVGTAYTASNPFSFTVGDSIFTFTGTGDIFNPTAVSTGGTAQVNTVFGSPTTYFTNRGTVTFGSGAQYAAFATPTTIRFSNGENFIGLRATNNGQTFYGYAFTTNNVLNSYAFESVAGATITASTAIPAAVPEPATWAMMIGGFGAMGGAMRYRRRKTVVTFA